MLKPLVLGKAQVEKVLLVSGLETSQALFTKADGIFLSVSRCVLAWESPCSYHGPGWM